MGAYDDNVIWDSRGNFEIPFYVGGGGSTSQFNATIPNPGNVISVLMNSNQPTSSLESWGLTWADMFFWYSPSRSSNRTVNNGFHHDFPGPGPFNEWKFDAVVIDLVAGELAVSTDNGAFTALPITGGPAPKSDTTIGVRMGGGTPSQPFENSMISDLAIVAGDVRTMPELMTAWNEYNQTGYTG